MNNGIFEQIVFLNESDNFKKYNIDTVKASLPDNDLIERSQEIIGVRFGPELKKYLLSYGFITYKYLEFYGITAGHGLESSMIDATKSLHDTYENTEGYIAFEFIGNGDTVIVDKNDNVFYHNHENNTITNLNKKIFKYLKYRFDEADKYD